MKTYTVTYHDSSDTICTEEKIRAKSAKDAINVLVKEIDFFNCYKFSVYHNGKAIIESEFDKS